MDILAHAMYGATLCSNRGLAGGRTREPGIRLHRDATVWWAIFFSLLPDMLSMWIPFALHLAAGSSENFFGHYGGAWLEVYRLVHSLVVALSVAALLFVLRRKIFIPSLAWAVHILCDTVSHGEGKFQTLIFYPISRWGFDGIPFWRHPEFMLAYWAVLPAVWLALAWWRRNGSSQGETGARR